jgi:hypothetical protein
MTHALLTSKNGGRFQFLANFCLCTRTKATRHFGLWYSRRAKQNTQDKPSHTCTRSHTQQQSGRLCSNAPSNPEAHFVIDRRLSSVLPSIPDIYILNTCTLHHVQNSHFQVSSRILRPAQARGTNAQVSSVTFDLSATHRVVVTRSVDFASLLGPF